MRKLGTLLLPDEAQWLDQNAVDDVQAMALQAGATFTLIWDDELFTVMFRHHDPPAVSFKPIWPNYDLFIGIINLIQV